MRNFAVFVLIVGLLVTVSCTKEGPVNGEFKQTEATFSLNPAGFGSPTTRAGVAVEENSIMNLWILQFDGTAENSKLITAEYKPTVGDLANMQLILKAGSNHTVHFVANTFDSSLFNEANAPLNTFTLLQFKEKTFSIIDENGMFTGSTDKYLRMNGSYIGEIPNKISSINLFRICSKISFNYISEDVSSVEDGVRFRITSVQLKNVPTTSSYISEPANNLVSPPPAVTDYPVTSGSMAGDSGESYSIGDYSGYVTYYMPENISGENSLVWSQNLKPLYAPAKSTWLEIKGEGIGNDGRVNEYATFKFYLGNNLTTSYNINTNTQYNISLKFKGINLRDDRLEVIRVSDIEIFQDEIIVW